MLLLSSLLWLLQIDLSPCLEQKCRPPIPRCSSQKVKCGNLGKLFAEVVCTQQSNPVHMILQCQTPPCQSSPKHRLQAHVLPRVPLFSIPALHVSPFCIPFMPSSPSSPPTHLPTLPAPLSFPLISPHPTFNQSCSIPPTTSQPKPTQNLLPCPSLCVAQTSETSALSVRSPNPSCKLQPRHEMFNRILSPIGCPSHCPCLYEW